jgi:hypothetical protein
MAFGPDGDLYVAEAGVGGSHLEPVSHCRQVPPPVGAYTGGMTARISRITPRGKRETVADRLPSTKSSIIGQVTMGVADVEFLGGELYALIEGGGCSHGNPKHPNGVVRVRPDGRWTYVANLSAWLKKHPTKRPDLGDFEPDGTWYSMTLVGDKFYVVEPNGGQLVKVEPSGGVARVVDISAQLGHVVPTGIAYHDGSFYIAVEGTYPITPRREKIYRLGRNGRLEVAARGLTDLVGVAFHGDRMFALSTSVVGPDPPVVGAGRIDEVLADGTLRPVVRNLTAPTAMLIRGDALYVANFGYRYPRRGQIVRVPIPQEE